MTALYVKSRQLNRCALVLLVLGLVGLLWGEVRLQLPSLRGGGSILLPLVLILPVAFAVVISLSTRSWLPELERTAPRNLARLRLVHAAGLCVLACALIVAPLAAGSGSADALAGVRNLLGCAGLGYIGAVLAGGELSWLLPLAYALPVPLLGVDASHRPESWAWMLDPAGAGRSWIWAGALIAVGVAAFAARDARPTAAAEVEP